MVKGDTPAQDKIVKKDFENLCAMWCTEVEIADFFDVDVDTLNTWCKKIYGTTFSEVYKKKCSKGNISLRRAQLKVGIEKQNPTMLLWLGKQYLGQRDSFEVESNQLVKVEKLLNKIEEEANK